MNIFILSLLVIINYFDVADLRKKYHRVPQRLRSLKQHPNTGQKICMLSMTGEYCIAGEIQSTPGTAQWMKEKVSETSHRTLINTLIDTLNMEMHLDGYHFCGPGTHRNRFKNHERGINALDEACRLHDIAYSKYKDHKNRRKADEKLIENVEGIINSGKIDVKQKMNCYLVLYIMKAKAALEDKLALKALMGEERLPHNESYNITHKTSL